MCLRLKPRCYFEQHSYFWWKMIYLHSRTAKCASPIPRLDRPNGDILPSEESASFLLWAYPRLLGWPRTVNWLFAPVVGNKIYPGDLWGVDSQGELLIIKTKQNRTRRLQNPFSDFFPYCKGEVREVWDGGSLLSRWRHLIELEEVFLDKHVDHLHPDLPLKGRYPGILPHSSHRDAVWRWQSVYLKQIVPKFRDGSYRRAVESGLRKRAARNNPFPFFVGVIATVNSDEMDFSQKAYESLFSLYRSIGPTQICLRRMRIGRDKFNTQGVQIRCWNLEGKHLFFTLISRKNQKVSKEDLRKIRLE